MSSFESFIEKRWLPGREKLAKHIPSLRRLSGKLGWLIFMTFAPWGPVVAVYYLESLGPLWYIYTQAVMVIGAFVLVDVIGLWNRECYQFFAPITPLDLKLSTANGAVYDCVTGYV